jgi:hypothetical protein
VPPVLAPSDAKAPAYRPKTIVPTAGRRAAPPPDEEENEFVPTPTSLTASQLFDDITPSPVSTSGPGPEPFAAQAARGSGVSAADEGMALLKARRFGEARTKLAEALRRDPRNRVVRVSYHLCVGHDLAAQGRADDARKQFESALVLDPQNADAVAALRSETTEKREQKRTFLSKMLDRKE